MDCRRCAVRLERGRKGGKKKGRGAGNKTKKEGENKTRECRKREIILKKKGTVPTLGGKFQKETYKGDRGKEREGGNGAGLSKKSCLEKGGEVSASEREEEKDKSSCYRRKRK